MALISSSFDGKIKIESLCADFDDMELEMGEEELTCFSTKGPFNPSTIEFFVGTGKGKLIYFYKGWISDTKEIIHNKIDEGPVTQVIFYHDLLAWSTP